MGELRPCPFCGSAAKILHVSQLWEPKDAYWAQCENHDCRMSGRHYTTEAEAIEKWNTRYADKGLSCPKCGNRLHDSDVAGYEYVCYECDENFYSFEAV